MTSDLLVRGIGAGLLIGLCVNGVAAQDYSDPLISGADEFEWHCASCHGDSAKGDGSLAEILIKRPPDLTRISERHGGTFPFERVVKIISGQVDVPGHDTFQMPKYWERFKHYEGRRGFESAEKRIHTIARYLESLQVDPSQ